MGITKQEKILKLKVDLRVTTILEGFKRSQTRIKPATPVARYSHDL